MCFLLLGPLTPSLTLLKALRASSSSLRNMAKHRPDGDYSSTVFMMQILVACSRTSVKLKSLFLFCSYYVLRRCKELDLRLKIRGSALSSSAHDCLLCPLPDSFDSFGVLFPGVGVTASLVVLYFLLAPPVRASLPPQPLQEIKHRCPLEVNLLGMWGARQSRQDVILH